MPATRKTIPVAPIIEHVNYYLENTPDGSAHRERRIGIASLLETILQDANAYAGFSYLPSANWRKNEEGYIIDIHQPDADESRRRYNTHHKLIAN